MNKEPIYEWHNDEGLAVCVLQYKTMTITGLAQCHPDDEDMKSRLTGETIAELRAVIKLWQFIRDFEITPQLKSLKQLYYSMNHSKYFDPRSYEAKMLYRQIKILEEDLKEVKEEIRRTREELRVYLNTKERDHATLREFISKRELVENNQSYCEKSQ